MPKPVMIMGCLKQWKLHDSGDMIEGTIYDHHTFEDGSKQAFRVHHVTRYQDHLLVRTMVDYLRCDWIDQA